MSQLPSTVYSAQSPLRNPFGLLREMFKGIWDSRELIWILFKRDLKAQYRESLLGYFWILAPPLMTMAIWVFLNSQRIIQVETDIPYPLFVLIGTTVWTSFATTITAPLGSFNNAKPVLMKLKVPQEAFIISGLLRSIFDLSLRLLLLIPVFFIFKFTPAPTFYLFPIAVLMVVSMGFAVGLMLVPIGGFYGDVSNAVGTFFGVLMYTAPVVFPIRDGLLGSIMRMNPLTPSISLCRESLTTGDLASLLPATMWFGVALVTIFVGFIIIRVAMPHLVARMGM